MSKPLNDAQRERVNAHRLKLMEVKRIQEEEKRKREEAKRAEEALRNPPPPVDEIAQFLEPAAPSDPEIAIPVTPAPRSMDPVALFREWLRSPAGQNATDPRLPEDYTRRITMLEDGLAAAFHAGFKAAQPTDV